MQLVLLHGWGFHAGLWRDLAPRLHPHEVILLDLGFVLGGPKGAARMPADAVCVGHSFGLMWLLKHGPRPMRGLVSLAGFDCFHAHVPTAEVERIAAGLDRNPAAQMRAFWRACGAEDFADPDQVDLATSKAALGWLMRWDARPERAALNAPILALASAADRILPKAASARIWGCGDADLRWHDSAGHALPLTAPDWCARHILEFVDGVATQR